MSLKRVLPVGNLDSHIVARRLVEYRMRASFVAELTELPQDVVAQYWWDSHKQNAPRGRPPGYTGGLFRDPDAAMAAGAFYTYWQAMAYIEQLGERFLAAYDAYYLLCQRTNGKVLPAEACWQTIVKVEQECELQILRCQSCEAPVAASDRARAEGFVCRTCRQEPAAAK